METEMENRYRPVCSSLFVSVYVAFFAFLLLV